MIKKEETIHKYLVTNEGLFIYESTDDSGMHFYNQATGISKTNNHVIGCDDDVILEIETLKELNIT